MPRAIKKKSTLPIIHRRLLAPQLQELKSHNARPFQAFLITLRKSTHLNEKPSTLVPESNSTIKTHMAKPNWGKRVPPKWLDGKGMSNSSWQKWVFPKKSEQGKWLNNELDFV